MDNTSNVTVLRISTVQWISHFILFQGSFGLFSFCNGIGFFTSKLHIMDLSPLVITQGLGLQHEVYL